MWQACAQTTQAGTVAEKSGPGGARDQHADQIGEMLAVGIPLTVYVTGAQFQFRVFDNIRKRAGGVNVPVDYGAGMSEVQYLPVRLVNSQPGVLNPLLEGTQLHKYRLILITLIGIFFKHSPALRPCKESVKIE